jgi:hypothetical protein
LRLAILDLGAAAKCSSKVVQQPGLAVKLVSETAQRVTGDLVGYLGVDLHRDCDLAVAQDAHGYAGVHVKGALRAPGRAGRRPFEGAARWRR